MSRATSPKRLNYIRAVYSPGANPARSFERLLRDALDAMGTMAETELELPGGETLVIRHRDVLTTGGLKIAIGLGVVDEAMSTLTLQSREAQDTDQPETPPDGRAFKLADAFCLIEGDDLLVCLDGGLRLPTLEAYLQGLLSKANFTPAEVAFELISRIDHDKAATLEAEGVKAFRVRGTAYAATGALDGNATGNAITQAWKQMKEAIRAVFEDEAATERERQVLADHWADLNIETVISVDRGSNGEPIVLKSLEEAAKDIQNDAPEGTTVTLVTRKGNPVTVDSLTLSTGKSIKRLQGQNDLDYADAWEKLQLYRTELVASRRWRR